MTSSNQNNSILKNINMENLQNNRTSDNKKSSRHRTPTTATTTTNTPTTQKSKTHHKSNNQNLCLTNLQNPSTSCYESLTPFQKEMYNRPEIFNGMSTLVLSVLLNYTEKKVIKQTQSWLHQVNSKKANKREFDLRLSAAHNSIYNRNYREQNNLIRDRVGHSLQQSQMYSQQNYHHNRQQIQNYQLQQQQQLPPQQQMPQSYVVSQDQLLQQQSNSQNMPDMINNHTNLNAQTDLISMSQTMNYSSLLPANSNIDLRQICNRRLRRRQRQRQLSQNANSNNNNLDQNIEHQNTSNQQPQDNTQELHRINNSIPNHLRMSHPKLLFIKSNEDDEVARQRYLSSSSTVSNTSNTTHLPNKQIKCPIHDINIHESHRRAGSKSNIKCLVCKKSLKYQDSLNNLSYECLKKFNLMYNYMVRDSYMKKYANVGKHGTIRRTPTRR